MNTLELIDKSFLSLAEKIAKPFYRLTGIDNFGMANVVFMIGMSMEHWSNFLISSRAPLIINTIITLFFDLVLWKLWIDLPKSQYNRNFLNRRRLEPFTTLRTFIMAITFGSTVGICLRLGLTANIVADILSANSSLVQLFSFYLASIEPEDPSDSILKKLWRKLGDLLLPESQTQPV